jgi:ABC-type polysaccharide/polyol phosphate transport system ATPase subunit
VTAEPAVVVKDVSKRFRVYHERNQTLKAALMRGGRATYEEFWALKNVSLEVPAGSTFGLIGHNGSGKSTLLKCMARILQPDAGRITVAGKMSALLELGAGFHPELSGRENVYLNGSILGLSRRDIDSKFDSIVEFAGLERFIDSPVKNYSSGMYVRLGFSVAINVDPDVLLVDEVLAVGDESFQQRCAEKFADLKYAGKTVVLVSHALGSVRQMCDQAAWLDHGELQAVGQPGELIDTYVDGQRAEKSSEVVTGGSRWGEGGASIDEVELLRPDGTPTDVVRTGEPVTVRLRYSATEPIPTPVFALEVHHSSGVQVSAPNTWEAEQVPDVLAAAGTVELRVDRLLLVPGVYQLSASVGDPYGQHIQDYRHHALRFTVQHGTPRESTGLVSLGGSWTLTERAPAPGAAPAASDAR